MSMLIMDLGNTRWKVARTFGPEIGTVLTGRYDEPAGLKLAAMQCANGLVGILVASVIDDRATDAVIVDVQRVLNLPVRRVRSTDPMAGVRPGYRKPEQLGVDRLLAMVAARARTNHPFCVIDAGTAVTVDLVDEHGDHRGGFILPGIRMFRDCLLSNTAIPRDAEIDEAATLGIDTPTAVALGARYAVAGLVERFTVGSARLFPDQQVTVFVGGGDADDFIEFLPRPCIKLDHLVLRGLAVVAASIEL